jgi:uncharacterized protein
MEWKTYIYVAYRWKDRYYIMEKINKTQKPVWCFFALSYVLSWAVWIPISLQEQGLFQLGLPYGIKDLGVYGPGVAALVIVACERGWPGIKLLLSRIAIWKFKIYWYALAIFGAGFLGLTALLISTIFGQADFSFAGNPPFQLFPLFLIWVIVFGGPLGEEVGWRGYALPALMVKYGVFRSSLIIGLFWSAWHLPLFWMPGTVQYELSFIIYTIMTVPLAFIYTWIHIGTGGSILAAILFHGASNTMAGFIPFMPVAQSGGTEATFYIFIGLLWLIVAVILFITRGKDMGYRDNLLKLQEKRHLV